MATKKKNINDTEGVDQYMAALDHPLKAEVEAIRKIILKATKGINERVKWNAPSFFYKDEDMVTFMLRAKEHVHLVFHHPYIVEIQSDLLEGDYKDRRMMYLKDKKAVTQHKQELTRIMQALTEHIDSNS